MIDPELRDLYVDGRPVDPPPKIVAAARQAALMDFGGDSYAPVFDRERLNNNLQRVLALLLDMKPHSTEELREVGGLHGDRRARDLRQDDHGGFTVTCWRDMKDPKAGLFLYHLVGPIREWQVQRVMRDHGQQRATKEIQ